MKSPAFHSLLACVAVAGATAGFAVNSIAEVPVAATVSAGTLALALEAEPAAAAASRSPQDWDGLVQLVVEYLDQALSPDASATSTTPTT